jgi:predicted regulator of Ras-like GTPase activity (Roadblock/LC7/MglB family)
MAETGRSAQMTQMLSDLREMTPGVRGAAVVSSDGLIVAAGLPEDVDGDQLAAVAGSLLSFGRRTCDQLGQGKLVRLLVEGENSTTVVVGATPQVALTVVVEKGAKLGVIFLQVRRTSKQVAALFGNA